MLDEYASIGINMARVVLQDICEWPDELTACTIVLDVTFHVGDIFYDMHKEKWCEDIFDFFYART